MVHIVGVPKRFEELVREAQRQDVLHRLLAQVVVDPEDRVRREHRLDDVVELPGRFEVVFASTHQMPLYPGTGAAGERGAHGQIVNVPLPPGAGGAAFRAAMLGRVLPAVEAHAPEMILISAGFDAHARDPLANLQLSEADFAWVTERLCALADRVCGGRIVSTLEGGYDLSALAASVAAHVRVLMERGHG